MKGSVFKRCSGCDLRMKRDRCRRCGGTRYSWAYVVDVGKDASGRRRQQLRAGFPTRKEADHKLREVLTSIDGGALVQPTKMSLAKFVRDEWLPATRPPRVKWQTWKDRRDQLETYVIPHIGGVALQDLNARHLNRLYADLLEDGRIRGPGGLSVSSVHGIHRILHKLLNDAVRWRLIPANPAGLADPPPIRVVNAARRRRMKTWSEQEVRRFLWQTSDDELHPLWHFALATGVRRSELLGATWTDLDLDGGMVTIRHTVLETEGGHDLLDEQKSRLSARTIHLDRRTCELLRRHRDAQIERRKGLADIWQNKDLVFADVDGSHFLPDRITTAFRRATAAAGVRRIRLHDLRHTNASLLLKAGVHPKIVSERLGHSSVAFTLDTYAHVIPGMHPEAAELLAGLILGPEEGPFGGGQQAAETAVGEVDYSSRGASQDHPEEER